MRLAKLFLKLFATRGFEDHQMKLITTMGKAFPSNWCCDNFLRSCLQFELKDCHVWRKKEVLELWEREIEQNEIWKIRDQIWKALTLYFPKISKFLTLEKLLYSRKFRRKSEIFQNRDFWEVFDQIWGAEFEFRSFRGVWGFLRRILAFDNKFWHFRPLLGVFRPWWVWDHYRPNSGRRMAGNQNFSMIFCALERTESGLSNARRINFISCFAMILKHFMYSNPNF